MAIGPFGIEYVKSDMYKDFYSFINYFSQSFTFNARYTAKYRALSHIRYIPFFIAKKDYDNFEKIRKSIDPTKIKTISFRNTSKGSGLTSTCAPLLIPTTFTS